MKKDLCLESPKDFEELSYCLTSSSLLPQKNYSGSKFSTNSLAFLSFTIHYLIFPIYGTAKGTMVIVPYHFYIICNPKSGSECHLSLFKSLWLCRKQIPGNRLCMYSLDLPLSAFHPGLQGSIYTFH